jgi:hypothetical protein
MHEVIRGARPKRRPPALAVGWLVILASVALFACSGVAPDGRRARADAVRAGMDAIGTPLNPGDLAAWDIDVAPDGRGLPAGSGDVVTGRHVYAAKCASCHGAQGQGLVGDRLVGGRGTLASANPQRTVGSYWPYATTLFDYIRRAMRYHAPQSLSADEVYALSAYLLNSNGIVSDDTRLDAHSLPAVKMPNRNGFVPDPRPARL